METYDEGVTVPAVESVVSEIITAVAMFAFPYIYDWLEPGVRGYFPVLFGMLKIATAIMGIVLLFHSQLKIHVSPKGIRMILFGQTMRECRAEQISMFCTVLWSAGGKSRVPVRKIGICLCSPSYYLSWEQNDLERSSFWGETVSRAQKQGRAEEYKIRHCLIKRAKKDRWLPYNKPDIIWTRQTQQIMDALDLYFPDVYCVHATSMDLCPP